MTKYSRKCRRGGSMAKTINVARRNKKKRTTRKKRGGGCVSSTCRPQSNEASQNDVSQLSQQLVYHDAVSKIHRFYNSQIINKLKKEYRDKVEKMKKKLISLITNDLDNLISFGHSQQTIEAYNNFRRKEPELSLLFDLPDDIINLKFDNKFQNRDELINYLQPAIIDLLEKDALNNVKFISKKKLKN
jgi:hypothetical protein